jgi:hypothetical protein
MKLLPCSCYNGLSLLGYIGNDSNQDVEDTILSVLAKIGNLSPAHCSDSCEAVLVPEKMPHPALLVE